MVFKLCSTHPPPLLFLSSSTSFSSSSSPLLFVLFPSSPSSYHLVLLHIHFLFLFSILLPLFFSSCLPPPSSFPLILLVLLPSSSSSSLLVLFHIHFLSFLLFSLYSPHTQPQPYPLLFFYSSYISSVCVPGINVHFSPLFRCLVQLLFAPLLTLIARSSLRSRRSCLQSHTVARKVSS